MPIQIIPAIIPKSLDDLREKVSRVRGAAKLVQVDVVDGKFAPGRSWPYTQTGYAPEFEKLVSEDQGLPFWEEVEYELDLMVSDPRKAAEDWIRAGAGTLIFHIESDPSIPDYVKELRTRFGEKGSTPTAFGIGIATKPSTLDDALSPCIEHIDFIQCMGSDRIGHQGEALDPKVYDKLERLHTRWPTMPLGVDIGVSQETVKKLARAGATRLVAGSAIFGGPNAQEAIESLRASVL